MLQKWLNEHSRCVVAAGVLITLLFVLLLVTSVGNPGSSAQTEVPGAAILDKFDMFMTNAISDSLDGVLSIEKVYWLNDDDMVIFSL